MNNKGLTKTIFAVGLIAAIVLSTLLTYGVATNQLAIGTQLLKGEMGAQGPKGDTGEPGATGANGHNGATGTTGAIGPQGPQGPQGPKGLSTPDYDSGWLNIAGSAGQLTTVTHNLNTADVIVQITGKASPEAFANQKYYGLTNYIVGWNQTYGGTKDDISSYLIKTRDGGYAMARYTTSFGAGGQDVWFLKTDSIGNVVINKTYGGPSNDAATEVIQTTDGGFAIVGTTYSYGAGSNDLWLLKTDSQGNIQWNKTYGGTMTESGWGIVQTNDGFALTGFTNTYGAGGDDLWVVKTDSTGNMQWNKTFGGAFEDRGYAIIKTKDNGYAITGATSSFGAGIQDSWLLKLDSYGNLLVNKTYGGPGFDISRRVIETTDSGFALLGTKHPPGDLNMSDLNSNFDMWLIKTDSLGTEQWNKTYGGSRIDESYSGSIIQTTDGGYTLAGDTASYGAGGTDFWLVKVDSYGNIQWSKTFGGPLNEGGYVSQVIADDGSYVICGTITKSSTDSDLELIKFSSEGEIGLTWDNSTENSITVYRGTNDVYWNYVRIQVWKIK